MKQIKANVGISSWKGEFQGIKSGSEVSIIFTRLYGPGGGPGLHKHPYSETFVVRSGTVRFSDGLSSFEASAGQIIVVPPNTPHQFSGVSESVEMIDIHASSTFNTEWLHRPTTSGVTK